MIKFDLRGKRSFTKLSPIELKDSVDMHRLRRQSIFSQVSPSKKWHEVFDFPIAISRFPYSIGGRSGII